MTEDIPIPWEGAQVDRLEKPFWGARVGARSQHYWTYRITKPGVAVMLWPVCRGGWFKPERIHSPSDKQKCQTCERKARSSDEGNETPRPSGGA